MPPSYGHFDFGGDRITDMLSKKMARKAWDRGSSTSRCGGILHPGCPRPFTPK